MLLNQKGLCAICGQPETIKSGVKGSNEIRKLAVDHNHDTNEVRGLLCFSCNSAIGAFKEDIEVMAKAIAYIQKHNKQKVRSKIG